MNLIKSKCKMSSENEEDGESDTDASISSESLPIAARSKVQVLLRIRPTAENEVEGLDDIYTVEDSSALLVKHFTSNEAARRSRFTKFGDNVTKKKFTFSRIFNQEVGQSSFFNEAIKPAVVDFLNNQSSTIITYGTADAGKTYSLFGTVSQLGVIPRTIELIYSSLNCTLVPWYKPKHFCSIVNLAESDRTAESEAREKLLSCRMSDKYLHENSYKSLEFSELNNNKELCKDSMYSVWISFVEIYNDAIYDLLEVDAEGRNTQLKLATDKHGATYIQGMRSVCATTGLEAYEILNVGQARLTTTSNSSYKKSRSHSLFIIKLLKYDKDSSSSEVQASSLSFYDLAGTARVQKSRNDEKQLNELKSINKSLLVLGRCIKVVVEGQSRLSAGPFRDSKLSRLVQRSLCGKENLTFLININPTVDLLVETQNVFNFSSMAMRLIYDSTKYEKRTQTECHTPIASPKSRDICLSARSKILADQDINDIVQKNKILSTELTKIKAAGQQKELEVRKELTDFFNMQLSEIEEHWKKRMLLMEEEKQTLVKFSVDQVNQHYKENLNNCSNRKRKRINGANSEENLDKTKNVKYSTKIKSLRKSLDFIKRNLRKFAEIINDATNTEIEIENTKDISMINLDDDVTLYLSTIQAFIKRSLKIIKIQEDSSRKSKSSTGIQCSVNSSSIDLLCKEIQMLLDSNTVPFPEIDDSLDSSDNIEFQNNDNNIHNLLPKVKELVISNISEKIKLEMANSEKSQEIRELKEKVMKLNKEILENNIRLKESESVRFMLLKQNRELGEEAKAKELFKNIDFVTTESENYLTNESTYRIVSPHRSSTSRSSFDNDSGVGLYLCEPKKSTNGPLRTSSGSSHDDSAVASSVECVSCKLTEDISCQTIVSGEQTENNSFQKRLTQLKLDYEKMTAQHQQEASKVIQLSDESEKIREAMVALKENTRGKDNLIADLQGKLRNYQMEIDRLNNEKNQLTSKQEEMVHNLRKKIKDTQLKLKIHQEGENTTAKRLEEYFNKSVDLKSELSAARLELEEKSKACHKNHSAEIDRLKTELNLKALSEQKLVEEILEYEKDRGRMNDLFGKLSDFEVLMLKVEDERSDLQRLLNKKSNYQSEVEDRLKYLGTVLDGRDSQIHALRSELGVLGKSNSSNYQKGQELSKDVSRLMEHMISMKDDLRKSQKARKAIEQNSKKEFENLRSKLTIFQDNAQLLNIICSSGENKYDDVCKLKAELAEKNSELVFFKKNRNATIQRYECLIQQLQDALKSPPSHKMKRMSAHKEKDLFSNGKDYSTCDIHGAEQLIRDWTVFLDDESVYLSPCPSLQAVTHDSSDTTPSKDGPTRLIADVSDKYIEILY